MSTFTNSILMLVEHLSYIQSFFSNYELWNFIPNGGLLNAEDLIQETPVSNNGSQKRGKTLM